MGIAPVVFRGMLRDIVACDDFSDACRMLGLIPSSPDVDEVEHLQSHQRLELFGDVADEALAHAEIAGDVLYRVICAHHDCAGHSEQAKAMYQFICRTAVATVTAHLLEDGTLAVGDME